MASFPQHAAAAAVAASAAALTAFRGSDSCLCCCLSVRALYSTLITPSVSRHPQQQKQQQQQHHHQQWHHQRQQQQQQQQHHPQEQQHHPQEQQHHPQEQRREQISFCQLSHPQEQVYASVISRSVRHVQRGRDLRHDYRGDFHFLPYALQQQCEYSQRYHLQQGQQKQQQKQQHSLQSGGLHIYKQQHKEHQAVHPVQVQHQSELFFSYNKCRGLHNSHQAMKLRRQQVYRDKHLDWIPSRRQRQREAKAAAAGGKGGGAAAAIAAASRENEPPPTAAAAVGLEDTGGERRSPAGREEGATLSRGEGGGAREADDFSEGGGLLLRLEKEKFLHELLQEHHSFSMLFTDEQRSELLGARHAKPVPGNSLSADHSDSTSRNSNSTSSSSRSSNASGVSSSSRISECYSDMDSGNSSYSSERSRSSSSTGSSSSSTNSQTMADDRFSASRQQELEAYTSAALRTYRLLRPDALPFYKEDSLLSMQSRFNEASLKHSPIFRDLQQRAGQQHSALPPPSALLPPDFDALQFNLPVLNPTGFVLALAAAAQSLAADIERLCEVLQVPGLSQIPPSHPYRLKLLLDALWNTFKLKKNPQYAADWAERNWPRLRRVLPPPLSSLSTAEVGRWLQEHLERVISNQRRHRQQQQQQQRSEGVFSSLISSRRSLSNNSPLLKKEKNKTKGEEEDDDNDEEYYSLADDFLFDDPVISAEFFFQRNISFPLQNAGQLFKKAADFLHLTRGPRPLVTPAVVQQFQSLVNFSKTTCCVMGHVCLVRSALEKIGLSNWLRMNTEEIEEYLPEGVLAPVVAGERDIAAARLLLKAAARGKANLLDFDAIDPFKLLYGFDIKVVEEELAELPPNSFLSDADIDHLLGSSTPSTTTSNTATATTTTTPITTTLTTAAAAVATATARGAKTEREEEGREGRAYDAGRKKKKTQQEQQEQEQQERQEEKCECWAPSSALLAFKQKFGRTPLEAVVESEERFLSTAGPAEWLLHSSSASRDSTSRSNSSSNSKSSTRSSRNSSGRGRSNKEEMTRCEEGEGGEDMKTKGGRGRGRGGGGGLGGRERGGRGIEEEEEEGGRQVGSKRRSGGNRTGREAEKKNEEEEEKEEDEEEEKEEEKKEEEEDDDYVQWKWKRPLQSVFDLQRNVFVRERQGVDSTLQLHALRQTLLSVNRMMSMNKQGRVYYFRAIVAVGNGRGLFGIGIDFGSSPKEARSNAALSALQQLQLLDLDPSHTLTTPVAGREYSAEVKIIPRAWGKGLKSNLRYLPLLYLLGLDNCRVSFYGPHASARWFTRAKALRRALQQLQSRRTLANATGQKYDLLLSPGDHWVHWPDRWFRPIVRDYQQMIQRIKAKRHRTYRRGFRSNISEIIPEECRPEFTPYTWKSPLQRWAEELKKKRLIAHNIYEKTVYVNPPRDMQNAVSFVSPDDGRSAAAAAQPAAERLKYFDARAVEER